MPSNERKPLVLCVDDEKSILNSLRRVFLDEPWDLRFAESGPEGLALIEEHGADVVLSDYRMPGMNGVEFLKKVKEIHPDCVRVVLSGYADVATILSALNEGEIYRFVNKPWNDAELLESVHKALEHQRLRAKNKALNLELERKVARRTREVAEKSRALHLARVILELMPTPVVGVDEQGAIVSANESARKKLDPGEKGLSGKPAEDYDLEREGCVCIRVSAQDNGVVPLVVDNQAVGLLVLATEGDARELLKGEAPSEVEWDEVEHEPVAGDLDQPRVLLVDDEKSVLKSLQRVLADEPYEVHTCTDPEDALGHVREHGPAVVVADYYMPKMTGAQFLQKVRGIDDSIVRLILTGKPDVVAVLEAVRLGSVYRFLLKPWDPDELRMSLRQAIRYHSLVVGHNELLTRLEQQRRMLTNYGADAPEVANLPKLEVAGVLGHP
jgi:two-component system NtrC family sensor kinase